MQPIVITQELISDAVLEVDIISRLVREYGCRVHIRKKNCTLPDLDYFCRMLSDNVDMSYLTLHGHVDLVEKYSFGGLHDKCRGALGAGKLFSVSCHSMSEADEAQCDYLFLSPIFDSISKQGYRSPYDMDELERWLRSRKRGGEVVALGGIGADNIKRVYDMGFDGAALLGAVWNEHNAIENYKNSLKNL